MNANFWNAAAGLLQALAPGAVSWIAASGWFGTSPNTAAITAAAVTLGAAVWSGVTTKIVKPPAS